MTPRAAPTARSPVALLALPAIALALAAGASSCRLVGVGIPCEADDNCPGALTCVNEVCGGGGGGDDDDDDTENDNGQQLAPVAGRLQCESSADCGGDDCAGDGRCAVTTWLTVDATLFELRVAGDALAFSSSDVSIINPCFNGTAVGIAARDQAPGDATFIEHDGECGITSLSAGDGVVAWSNVKTFGSDLTAEVRALAGNTASTVATFESGLSLSVAAAGSRVYYVDGGADAVRASDDDSATLPAPSGTFGATTLAADEREVWVGAGNDITIAPADPAQWSQARTIDAPDGGNVTQIELGATRAFMVTPISNGQQRITAVTRSDNAVIPLDTVDENESVHALAAAGDNLFAVEGSDIRVYPADGSPRVSLASGSAIFGLAFADGFLWWARDNVIERVRVAP